MDGIPLHQNRIIRVVATSVNGQIADQANMDENALTSYEMKGFRHERSGKIEGRSSVKVSVRLEKDEWLLLWQRGTLKVR